MILFLLKYWQPLAASFLTGLLAWGIHSLDVTRIEAEQSRVLAHQADVLRSECKTDKDLTSEVSHAYQTQIADLARQLDSLKRLHPAHCIPLPASSAAPGHDAAAGNAEPARPDGLDTDALYDFAADAETDRLKLIACQSFISKTWAAKKQ